MASVDFKYPENTFGEAKILPQIRKINCFSWKILIFSTPEFLFLAVLFLPKTTQRKMTNCHKFCCCPTLILN